MNALVRQHLQSALNSLGTLTRTPLATLVTVLTIAIALTLPTLLFTLLQNTEPLNHTWQQNRQISIYLKQETPPAQITLMLQSLKSNAHVTKVRFISPKQGLESLQQQPEFATAIQHLSDNPLPPVITLTPSLSLDSPEALRALVHQLKRLPNVELVKLDLDWLQKLANILQLIQQIAIFLALLLAIAVLLVVGTAIHVATSDQREEIEILKLLGATHAFIRRPFLYTGFWYGLGAGLTAWSLVNLIALSLQKPINQLATLYGTQFVFHGLNVNGSLLLLSISLGLGVLGARFSVR